MKPYSQQYLSEIDSSLRVMFEISGELFQHCYAILSLYKPGIDFDSKDFDRLRYRISNAICAKACKSFRASVILTQHGVLEDLRIVSRSLFETFVAANFVLKDNLKISKEVGNVSAGLRARLYLAHGILKRYDSFLKHADSIEPAKRAMIERRLKSDADNAIKEIGQTWADRLRKPPKTYSSLSLRTLVERLEEPAYCHWYDVVYSEQSQHVHASDPGNHVYYDDQAQSFQINWEPDPKNLSLAHLVNGLLLGGCFLHLTEHYDFGPLVRQELGHLVGQFEKLMNGL